MAATATIISAKRLSNVLLLGSVAERKSPDNRMFGRFPVNAALSGSVAERKSPDNRMFDRFPGNAALSGPWSDSGRVLITPASAAAVRGANFATAKFRDAYGSPLEAIVMH
jgi:hypothetical protein